jgi:hypothetical protein
MKNNTLYFLSLYKGSPERKIRLYKGKKQIFEFI